MSWYSKNYSQRAPIAVDNTAGSGGSFDVQATIPADMEEFWSVVQSNGYDIRVTGPDGITPITFKRSTWDYANRSAVIQVDNLTLAAAVMGQIWLYWGYAAATDGAGSFTASTPLTGSLLFSKPGEHRVQVRPERPGDTAPVNRITKSSAERTRIAWDFRGLLYDRLIPYNGKLCAEEITEVVSVDVQLGGASQAGMIDVTLTRLLDGWVSTWIKAGTSPNTYTALVVVDTTTGRRLQGRALVYVQDLKET